MPRRISRSTYNILWSLWMMPWAAAADLARVTRYEETAVANVLSCARGNELLLSTKLGRLEPAVARFVFSEVGVKQFHERYGWTISWWHSASGVRDLAGRLEVVEMAYKYLPVLWQSNLVDENECYVYGKQIGTLSKEGEPRERWELQLADWRYGRLWSFCWLERGRFEAVVSYWDGRTTENLLYVPVLWRTKYQLRSGIEWVRRDMRQVFVEDERWNRLSTAQAISPEYHPGAVVLCPERVSAAMVQRHMLESWDGQKAIKIAIIDGEGQVIRSMRRPSSWWKEFVNPSRQLAVSDIKDISGAVQKLGEGPAAAVNGVRAWRVFNTIAHCAGLTPSLIADAAKLDGSVTRRLLMKMEEQEVVAVEGLDRSHYLDFVGTDVLAHSLKVKPNRTAGQRSANLRKGSRSRLRLRRHNQGETTAFQQLREHGFDAFPSMDVPIEYRVSNETVKVAPDGFVVLPPGVLVPVEYERSATTPGALERKAEKYERLRRIGRPLPVLFITETSRAARILAEFGYRYILATSLDAVREGPHGKSVIEGQSVRAGPGCWWYRLAGTEAPRSDLPIDLVSQLYALDRKEGQWLLPLDNPFVADLSVFANDFPREED